MSSDTIYRIVNAWLAFCSIVAVAALWTADIRDDERVGWRMFDYELPELCTQKVETGVPCDSCGLTRSCISFLHGEFDRSRAFHIHGVYYIACLLSQLVFRLFQLRKGSLRQWWLELAFDLPLFALVLT
tara:strand:- start:2193 stop:2579 length:387 start_codon:yes stop_codon:yes gene_type:complete